jgi:hypothetical protein
MATPGSSVRLVGGPPAADGTVTASSVVVDGLVLVAVRGGRWCALAELRHQCTDREAAQQLASTWTVARYEIWGRPRRLRPQLYRHTGSFALAATRDPQGHWTVVPGRPASGGPTAVGRAPEPGASVWARLEDDADRAAARFRRVAGLLPDGPLADRALGAVRSGDACVADASRLCAVGAAVAPDWQPGSPDEEAASLVARITSLLGTIDAATRELVRLHLELGDPEPPAEALALLAASVAELEDYQRGDQAAVRRSLDSH